MFGSPPPKRGGKAARQFNNIDDYNEFVRNSNLKHPRVRHVVDLASSGSKVVDRNMKI